MLMGSKATGGLVLKDSWTQTNDSGTITYDLTGRDFQAGDICLIAWTCDGPSGAHTLAGWTVQEEFGFSTGFTRMWRRVLQAGDTTFTSSTFTEGQGQTAVGVIFGRAAEPDAADSNIAGDTSPSAPNPPSITSVVPSDFVITHAGLEDESVTLTAPSGFTLIETVGHTAGSYISTTGIAYATGLSGTVDPGEWGGTSSSRDWGATTLRLSRG